MKKYTIKDLKNGKVAVVNDGTLEELKEVLSKAFPDDKSIIYGLLVYYKVRLDNSNKWCPLRETDLPTQSVKDFLTEEEFIIPERWCVRGSEELGSLLNPHTNVYGRHNDKYYFNNMDKGEELSTSQFWEYADNPISYTEITFEQFEKYILNNNTKTNTMEYRITYKKR